jgi:hypothetical protein
MASLIDLPKGTLKLRLIQEIEYEREKSFVYEKNTNENFKIYSDNYTRVIYYIIITIATKHNNNLKFPKMDPPLAQLNYC